MLVGSLLLQIKFTFEIVSLLILIGGSKSEEFNYNDIEPLVDSVKQPCFNQVHLQNFRVYLKINKKALFKSSKITYFFASCWDPA